MKKIIIFIFVIFCFVANLPYKTVYASSEDKIFLLGNSSFEQVLEQNNMFKKFHIASLTKLMTAYICYNYVNSGKVGLDSDVIVSKKASEVEPSKAYIQENNSYKFEELFKVMLIKSANDCAIALAEYISGTEEKFSELMNETAKELGMKSSHYTNASGLSTPQQYSTAYDQYLLFLNILKINYIVDILKQPNIVFNNGEKDIILYSTNKLINKNIIGKTGYTLESKNCFCGCNFFEENSFIYITFNQETSEERFNNVINSINDAKHNYFKNVLVDKKEQQKDLSNAQNLLTYKNSEEFSVYQKYNSKPNYNVITKFNNKKLPIKKGDKVGETIVLYNNRIIKRVDIISQNEVKRISIISNIKRIINI